MDSETCEEKKEPSSPPAAEDEALATPPIEIDMEIHSVNALGYWSWNVQNETCAICRNAIMERCVTCLALRDREHDLEDDSDESQQLDNEPRCPYQKGACNHVFHQHCISRWLRTRYVCPLCNQEWNS